MGDVRFSVLLPTHNRADVLALAIRSVLAQTEPDLEVLVVADGCTDDTAAVVRAFVDPRVRLFDLPKAPHFGYANRNIALREARGRYVAFLGHDNLLLPDHLALMGAALDRDGVEIAYSRPLWMTREGTIVPFAVNLGNADELEQFIKAYNTIPATCIAHRRDCLDRHGYWPEDLEHSADWRLWIRFIEGGGRRGLAYVPEPTMLHFRANWRNDAIWGPPPLQALTELAASSAWWPAGLKVPPIEDGRPQQAGVLDLIEADAAGFAARVRKGTSAVLDRLAREYGVALSGTAAADARRQLQQSLDRIAHLQGQVARLAAVVPHAKAHLMPDDAAQERETADPGAEATPFVAGFVDHRGAIVGGWAVDGSSEAPCLVEISINGGVRLTLVVGGVARADVRAAYPHLAHDAHGFNIDISSLLAAGRNDVEVRLHRTGELLHGGDFVVTKA